MATIAADFATGMISSGVDTKKSSASNGVADISHKSNASSGNVNKGSKPNSTLDFQTNFTKDSKGNYYTDKSTIDEIGKAEAKGKDFSNMNVTIQQTRPSTEGGLSTVKKYSDKDESKFIIHEVTDANGNIIHRDFDAVRLPSGQLVNKK